ncbi:MAG TPA: hypothetical protein VNL15_05975 [Dehalococcoidia bacterium]|nr:hypothetical protein [Dehalococcoidia bacterium]
MRIALIAIAVVAIAACGGQSAPKQTGSPTPVTPREAVRCGHETNVHGTGYDAEARACLWEAVSGGQPVAFTTTIYTIEGDPVTYSVEGRAADDTSPRFSVRVDSQDRFGVQGKFTYRCSDMQRVQRPMAPELRYSFVLRGCTGEQKDAPHLEGSGEILVP